MKKILLGVILGFAVKFFGIEFAIKAWYSREESCYKVYQEVGRCANEAENNMAFWEKVVIYQPEWFDPIKNGDLQ